MTTPTDHDREHAFAERLAAGRSEHGRLYPLKRDVAAFADALLGILFPQLSDDATASPDDLAAHLVLARRDLRISSHRSPAGRRGRVVATPSRPALPEIHARLVLDAEAIAAGDPAAESVDEVIAAYPGFLAIAIHRIAHEIHHLGVPILPRLLAEVAHTRTGVDIHPGASIGRSLLHRPRHRRRGRRDRRDRRRRQALPGRHARRPLGDQERRRHASAIPRSGTASSSTPTPPSSAATPSSATTASSAGNVFLTNSVPPDSIVYQSSQFRIRRVRDGFEDADFVI